MCLCLPSKTEFQEGGIRLSSFAESLEEAHSRCLINFCWITLCKPNSLSIDDPTRGSPQLLLTTTSALHSTWPFSASSQIEISVLLQVQIFVRENLIGFFRISHSLLSQSAVAEAGWLSEAVAYLRREKLVIFSTCAGLSMVSGAQFSPSGISISVSWLLTANSCISLLEGLFGDWHLPHSRANSRFKVLEKYYPLH